MKIGYDGTLKPAANPAMVSEGGTQVNSRIVRDVANATPEAQKLFSSILDVGRSIAETGKQIRDADFAVDSQYLRMDYANAMEGVRKELSTRNFKDFDEYRAAFSEKEQAARESVINNATGDGGYFRNYNSVWKRRVNEDLDFLRGNAELNAMKTWNQLQVKNHYDRLDKMRESAISMGSVGLPILQTAIQNDNRIPEDMKQFEIANGVMMQAVADARKNAQAWANEMWNQQKVSEWETIVASQKNGYVELENFKKQGVVEARAQFNVYNQEYNKIVEELKKTLPESTPEQRAYKAKILQDFKAQRDALREEITEKWVKGFKQNLDTIRSRGNTLDADEYKKYLAGGVPAITRPGAQILYDYEQEKERLKQEAKQETKTQEGWINKNLIESYDANTGLFIVNDKNRPVAESLNTLIDSKAGSVRDKNGNLIVFHVNGVTLNREDFGSEELYVESVQELCYNELQWWFTSVDLTNGNTSINQLVEAAQFADKYLTLEQQKEIHKTIRGLIFATNTDCIPQEVLDASVFRVKEALATTFGYKSNDYKKVKEKYPYVDAELVSFVSGQLKRCKNLAQATAVVDYWINNNVKKLTDEAKRRDTVNTFLTEFAKPFGERIRVYRLDKSVVNEGEAPVVEQKLSEEEKEERDKTINRERGKELLKKFAEEQNNSPYSDFIYNEQGKIIGAKSEINRWGNKQGTKKQ